MTKLLIMANLDIFIDNRSSIVDDELLIALVKTRSSRMLLIPLWNLIRVIVIE